MGENSKKEMSKGRVAQIVALAIVLCAAPVLSCSIVAATDRATNIGGYIQGSTAAASYAFKGQTAPNNGLWCDGCAKYEAGATSGTAGQWWTVADVADQAPSPGPGKLCPADGTTCIEVNAAGVAATKAGKFYSSSGVTAGQTATTTGVLCPNNAQGSSPGNTCVAADSGAIATYLGTACVGSTSACTAVINGYTATANGVNCPGCVYKNSGETANVEGLWWTAADVADQAPSPGPGVLCPADGTPCTDVTAAGVPAAKAGKFYSSATVQAGVVATSAGVLCPSDTARTNYATTSPYSGPIATTSQGTAVGTAASNSAYKTTVLPLVAVITGFAMMMLK